MKFGLINTRSVNNKVNELNDHIVENELDIVAVTETWMSKDGISHSGLCPAGYDLLQTPRAHGKGGGVAIMIKSSLNHTAVKEFSNEASNTFEYQESTVRMKRYNLDIIIVYRPPPNSKNKYTVKQFFQDFSTLLERKIVSPNKLLIVGDFNFHIDNNRDIIATQFLDLLTTFDLKQHVHVSTNKSGHTLDLMITRSTDNLVQDVQVNDTGISDHFWVHSTILGPKPKTVKKEITYRKTKSINVDHFKSDIATSSLGQLDTYDNVNTIVSSYNTLLEELLDKHAPVITRIVTVHPQTLWYNHNIDEAKKERRRAEKLWRSTKLSIHRDLFIAKKEIVNTLLQEAKVNHYTNLISDANDQKKLFRIVNELTNKKKIVSYQSIHL